MTKSILNEQWQMKPDAVKVTLSIYFCGMSFEQDAIKALVHLAEGGVTVCGAELLNGVRFDDDSALLLAGDSSLRVITFAMPDELEDKLLAIRTALISPLKNKPTYIDADHFLSDDDQYGKIQVTYRKNDGEWNHLIEKYDWID